MAGDFADLALYNLDNSDGVNHYHPYREVPPAGIIGKVIAKMFQREPAIQARRDLRRFKQLMETGEIATGARSRAQMEEGKN